MTDGVFRIEVVNLHWLNKDQPAADLCAHGAVLVSHGARTVVNDRETGHAVSTGALHLLRAVSRDHPPQDPLQDHLVPCCGHFMVLDQERGELANVGCPSGLNWWVRHRPDASVELRFGGGEEIVLSLSDWRKAVVAFSSAVRRFYFEAERKRPTDPADAEWYPRFLHEWETRHSREAAAV